MKKEIIALMYDFDRTLASEDMQNFGFIPSLGMTPEQFWKKTEEFCQKNDTDKILGYMYVMIEEAKKHNIVMNKDFLKSQGANVEFYNGVLTWFKRINEYADSKGIVVEHYLITSGNKEIVEGTKIAKEFAHIFGCEYYFDTKTKQACWPVNMVNYTQKTQYFFRISKGIFKNHEDRKVNEKTPNRRIPYKNMIYFGDGLTDVPIMILVKNNGGTSIAVYHENDYDKVAPLCEEGRVNFVCKADYSKDKDLEKLVKFKIDMIAGEAKFINKNASIK